MTDISLKNKTITYKFKTYKTTCDEIPPWTIISTLNNMFKLMKINIKIEEAIISTDEMEITIIQEEAE